MATSELSWSVGPAESRLVRWLFYAFEGILLGVFLYSVVVSEWIPVNTGIEHLVVAALVFYGATRAFWRLAGGTDAGWVGATADRVSTAWIVRDWVGVRRWRWTLLVALVFSGGLVLGESRFPGEFSNGKRVVVWLLVGSITGVLGYALSTRGEIDRGSLTLTYPDQSWRGPGDCGSVPLRYLSDVRHVTLGQWTILWLSFIPGTPDRLSAQGLYVFPTTVVERSWSALEGGIEAPAEPVTIERSYHREILSLLVAYVSVAVALLVGVSWLGASVVVLAILAMVIGIVGVVAIVAVIYR